MAMKLQCYEIKACSGCMSQRMFSNKKENITSHVFSIVPRLNCDFAVVRSRQEEMRWGKEADWLVAAGTSSSGGWRRGCSWYHRLWSLWECNQVVTWPCWTLTLASCALSGLLSTPYLWLVNWEEMCFLFCHMNILGVWWFRSDNVAPKTYEPWSVPMI